jgi:two-component system response regulator RstA
MKPHAARILVVEDDDRLAALVQEYLEREGFAVAIEDRGDRALERIRDERPDLVVLDLMLPGLDGLSICRQVRAEYAGAILMLTARGEEMDEILGLDLGADDYLAKPVRPRRLLARIQALLRRRGFGSASPPGNDRSSEDAGALGGACASSGGKEGPHRLRVGALVVDPGRREATFEGEALSLTTAEFELLRFLAEHAGEVVSRETIYQSLRGIPYDGMDRSMDLRVARLRRKLGDDGRQPRVIKSVRGEGYLLVVGP